MSTYGYKLRDSTYRPETEKVSARLAAQDAAAEAAAKAKEAKAKENANKAAHAKAATANNAKKTEATTTRETFKYFTPTAKVSGGFNALAFGMGGGVTVSQNLITAMEKKRAAYAASKKKK